MRTGKEYLDFVEEKLKTALSNMDETIKDVQDDIQRMNDYYWENYTEMDEYGYEIYDNQQALLTQVNMSQEHRATRSRLKKMLDNPFFGRIDFIFDDEDDAEPESFYIGIGNFSETHGDPPLIYDWRAPISSLFYDYDRGLASYMAPCGEVSGEITSKWQYKIRRGKMIYELESEMVIDDEILKQELSSKGDTKLKSIVHTIQREQNAIIRNVKDAVLVIQGVAGSGKTSVALHRIAYLLYHDRQHLNSSNVLILSPNTVFSDYISQILPELGEEHIQEMSLDLFAYKELRGIVQDCEDRFHQIERLMSGIAPEEEARYRFKQSQQFVEAVEGFILEAEDRLMNFESVSYRGFTKDASEILKFFYEKFPELPLLKRMEAIFDYFVDEYETLTGKTIKPEDLDLLRARFDHMYETKDIYRIYNMLLEDLDFPVLPDVEPEKRYLVYEDVFPMLYLKERLETLRPKRKIRHLVIDEMQDYSYVQFMLLNRMFQCNMTILGDRAQTVDKKVQDAGSFLPQIFKKRTRYIEMNKSYRNTTEIADYAQGIGQVSEIEYMSRHGKPVQELSLTEADAIALIASTALSENAANDFVTDDFETAAVLTMTEAEAIHVYGLLKQLRDDVHYIDRNSSKFNKGITVTTFYMAKGLEFDQVFQYGADETNPLYQEYRYITATRALHELYVLSK